MTEPGVKAPPRSHPVEGWSANRGSAAPRRGGARIRSLNPGFRHPFGTPSSGAINQRPLRGPSTQSLPSEAQASRVRWQG